MAEDKASSRENAKGSTNAEQSEERERKEARKDSPEDEPAVDRGERIATGKAIARGGKEEGFVPGAEPDH